MWPRYGFCNFLPTAILFLTCTGWWRLSNIFCDPQAVDFD
ncbi:hypothetical protein ALC56_09295 [Trachymyrmex septentrionalis]|uniref:Uncharacterized protein n=1 Tax=Trachymyrmex septentrionalis TaxID=34720 RepID=A0A195F6W0_9HYME|nr:hypothetical protein ALC56_09295 [Trachymyrmex septentrionalis]